jgi:hypothetical protein
MLTTRSVKDTHRNTTVSREVSRVAIALDVGRNGKAGRRALRPLRGRVSE